MKPAHDALLQRFRGSFPKAAIQIDEESHLHVDHSGASGGAGHFRVRVIDARFHGLPRISRHRLVAKCHSLTSWALREFPRDQALGASTSRQRSPYQVVNQAQRLSLAFSLAGKDGSSVSSPTALSSKAMRSVLV